MARKTIRENFRVEVEPRSVGDFGYFSVSGLTPRKEEKDEAGNPEAATEAPQQPENYEIRSINEILAAEAALRAELESIRKEAETNQKWAFLEWRDKAERAEAENAQLREALRRLRDQSAAVADYRDDADLSCAIEAADTALAQTEAGK